MVSDSPFPNVKALKGIQSQEALLIQTYGSSGQSGLSQLPDFSPGFCCSSPNLLISCTPTPTHCSFTTPSLEKPKKLIKLISSLLLYSVNPCMLFHARRGHRRTCPVTQEHPDGTGEHPQGVVQLKPAARCSPSPAPGLEDSHQGSQQSRNSLWRGGPMALG